MTKILFTSDNGSDTSTDSRPIRQIIFEKANFGAVPIGFNIEGDARMHPVQWTRHPHLESITFSDGSVILVSVHDPIPEDTVGKSPVDPENQPDASGLKDMFDRVKQHAEVAVGTINSRIDNQIEHLAERLKDAPMDMLLETKKHLEDGGLNTDPIDKLIAIRELDRVPEPTAVDEMTESLGEEARENVIEESIPVYNEWPAVQDDDHRPSPAVEPDMTQSEYDAAMEAEAEATRRMAELFAVKQTPKKG